MSDDTHFVRVFRTDIEAKPDDVTFISFMRETPDEMFRATDKEFITRNGATPRECIMALVEWVRQNEREACAKIVEKLDGADAVYPEGLRMLATAIRARKDKP